MKNSVAIQFSVGSSHDTVGKEGLAHIVEHLLTHSNNPENEYIAREKEGVSCFAFTYKERTIYFASSYMLPIEKVLVILLDQLSREIPKEALAKEKDTVLSEMAERHGNIAKMAHDGVMKKCSRIIASTERYSHPVIGTGEGLKSIRISDVERFVEKHYRNPSIAITASRNLEKNKVKEILATIASSGLRFEQPGKTEKKTDKINPAGKRFDFNIKNTQIKGICVDGADRTREALYLGIMKQYLAGNWSSVFNRKMRSDKQLAYFAYGSIEAFSSFGLVYTTYDVLPNKKKASDSVANKIFKDLELGRIDKDAFIAAKKMRMTEMLATFSNEEDLLDDFLYSNRNPWNSEFYTLEQYIREIENLTLKDFTAYAKRTLQNARKQ